MKKTNLVIAAALVLTGFTACKNIEKETAAADAARLSEYVDSVENQAPVYTEANWRAIDDGYQARALKAEKNMAALEEADKAKTDASKAKYAALKTKYEFNIKENEATAKVDVTSPADYRQVLRNRLFGEGKVGNDMKFSFVTAENIHDIYKNFVNTVEDNKKVYTREDWDEINVLYEALDTRKNAVEKDLAASDNIKIARLKIRFVAVMATHRGGAKVKENSDSKQ